MAQYVVFFKSGDLAKDFIMNEEEFETFKKEHTSYYVDFVDERGCCFDGWSDISLEEVFSYIKEDLEDSGEGSNLYRIGYTTIDEDFDILCIEDNGATHFL